MASLTDRLFDLTRSVPYAAADVTAYLAIDQGLEVLNEDGTPIAPLGTSQGHTISNLLGVFTILGLVPGTVYDLWVQPIDQDPFWITNKVPDVVVEEGVRPLVLYGRLADPKEIDVVWAFLESPCVVTGGLHISQGVVFRTPSEDGSFTLELWPTESLTPPALYRVIIGNSTYRGSVPSLTDSMSLDDWIALPTTQVLE